ncbi:uncharacterized protein LOC135471863 isoform X2 [Liolophura sinensis]|uniref:uncharacterized protein LOC135471863 isoform X2 n=1 Tax=Liolophura sinensis TaxID=3198878 RepID=UPI00315817D1
MKEVKVQEECPSQTHTGGQLQEKFRKAMSKVPQPVVVVSTAEFNENEGRWMRRGVTCASFTSVSLDPPVVSFCVNRTSRFHNILQKSKHFAINVLSCDQVQYGVHFSKPALEDKNQFESVPFEEGLEGVPVISGCSAVLECQAHAVHSVGDHQVWYGTVLRVLLHEHAQQSLLYFTSSYRSVGDEIFLKAFEDATLPFEEWTHEAHLRMAWNYITQFGKDGATPLIKKGILNYNEKNKDKIKTGYHETVTMFYIHLISDAIQTSGCQHETFEDFIANNSYLMERSLILNYYSPERIADQECRHRFMEPDKKALP